MPKPLDVDKKERIQARYTELRRLNPLGVNHIALLANEFHISAQGIRYHLDEKTDARSKYTDEERAMIRTMNRAELAVWAKANGRKLSTVYALKLRLQHTPVDETGKTSARKEKAIQQGYMDFSDRNDLQAFDLPPNAFEVATAAITSMFPAASTMSLIAPNFLYHNPTKRHYTFTLAEQIALMENARNFIRQRAATIAAGWQGGEDTVYCVTIQNQHGDIMCVEKFDALDGATRVVHWLNKNLRSSTAKVDITAPDRMIFGHVSRVILGDTELQPVMTETELVEFVNLPDPLPERPAKAPYKLPPAPLVYRDITNEASREDLYIFRCSADKAPTEIHSPTLDDAASYYSRFQVDEIKDLLALIEEEGKWLVVYDSHSSVIAQTENAPEYALRGPKEK